MNLRFNLVFMFLLFVSIGVFAQKQQNVTLALKNVTLKNFIETVEKQVDYTFVYDNTIDVSQRMSVTSKNENVADLLMRVLPKLGISYEFVKKQIILKSKDKTKTKKYSGTVFDTKGEPVIGATVTIKGKTNGAITDVDGRYSIEASIGDVLQFSFIGCVPSNLILKDDVINNITLTEDTQSLDEVVVVGYGTQKKVNLTGSVASIGEKSLDSRPITQSSQALAGLVSGVTVSLSQGNPGADGATIRVRGQGTFSSAGSDPLVLIDGISASLDDVNPDNIKSISVLKDAASASIYGTRAANGVILIETKRGQKGKSSITYNGYVGWQKATELPEYVDSWVYAEMRNEADRNQDLSQTYHPEDIAKYRDGRDPDNYPNVNHLKDLVTSGSGFQSGHNISFSGGGDKFTYLLSLGYLHQEGIVAKNSYDKYNIQFNIDNQILDNLHLKADISAYASVQKEPRSFDGLNVMIGYAAREPSIFAGRKSDGTYGYQDNYCPEGWMDSPSFTNRKHNQFMGGVEFEWNPFKNFYISAKGGYKYFNNYDKDYVSELVYDQYKTYSPNSLTVENGWNSLITLQALARYSMAINKHHLNFLVGASQEEFRDNWGKAYRKSFPNDELYELNAGSENGQTATGSAAEWALRSYFGRINYSFNDRYLLEINARYDGTSRFPSQGRWGLFPSASLAWRLSEESFIKDKISWIDNLKLRISIGKLGNQNVGNYPYQNVISLTKNYPFGNKITSGASVTTLSNSDISWETTQIIDLGLDFSIFQGKLDAVIDVYSKKTSDILYNIKVSDVLGMKPSENNAASVKNNGFEIALTYRGKIGKFNYGISPNFSYTHNEVTSLANGLREDINSGLFVGESLGAIYGYVADGLFVDEEDIKNYPEQPYVAEPGFVRYKDISGPDGKPDGKVDATYDRKVIGTTLPKMTYGLTLFGDYKNIDFSILFSGMGGNKSLMHNYMAYAFFNGGSIQQWQVDNRWTKENPDRNAKYIKLTTLSANMGTLQTSTYWLRDASFFRLKNIQVGYTLPSTFIHKLGLEKLRIYFSGQNLLCFNKFYKGWDPEGAGNHLEYYPITSVYTVGLNVKF